MKLRYRVMAAVLAVITCSSVFTLGVSAKKFAKQINTNLGISTQYAYEENNPSWLRKFIIKENHSIGIVSVNNYPSSYSTILCKDFIIW